MESESKYEHLYRKGRDVCGPPFPEFVEFFNRLDQSHCKVLDLGCGQGRDALFIARKGHRVLGVDVSKTGIAQMLADAKEENLHIEGIVDDIVAFTPNDEYDVVLLDRVLHMLGNDSDRRIVLQRACHHTKPGGFVLIADTPKHKEFLRNFFDEKRDRWEKMEDRKGFLFVHKSAV